MDHAPPNPNADQIRYWNENGGARWLSNHATIARQMAVLGLEAIERAAVAPGSRVLDVGCGCGDSTFELARRVGPNGTVTGLDVSLPLLHRALEEAFEAGAANVSFTRADAQTATLPEAAFDLLFSRFGVMFFTEPETAFRNLRRALRPGARLTFLCWRALAENPMMFVPARAVADIVPITPPAPHAPGPFAFADSGRVRGFLERAGFTEVAFEELDRVLEVGAGAGLDETAAFLTRIGPAGAALASADPDTIHRAVEAIRAAIAPYHTPEGVRMPSATWIVTGRAPA